MSGEFDSRKDLQSTKFEQRPPIFVKLSFREIFVFDSLDYFPYFCCSYYFLVCLFLLQLFSFVLHFCCLFPWLISLYLLFLLFPGIFFSPAIISRNAFSTFDSISPFSVFSPGLIFKSSLYYLAYFFNISSWFSSFWLWLLIVWCGFCSFFFLHHLPICYSSLKVLHSLIFY